MAFRDGAGDLRYPGAMAPDNPTSAAFVRDRMTSPVVTVPDGASLAEVAAVMEARAVSALPVVQGEVLVGLVSTTDLVGAFARDEAGAATLRASEVMTHPVATTGPDRPLVEAARAMAASRIHRLVVTDGDGPTAGRPRGVLSARDVLEDVRAAGSKVHLADVMTSEVRTLDVGDSVERAMQELAEARVHGLVVVENGRPVGVFTHAEALAARKLPPSLRGRPVEEVMSYETICLDVTTTVARAAAYAGSMNVRRILVVDQRHLVGVASALDLVRSLA